MHRRALKIVTSKLDSKSENCSCIFDIFLILSHLLMNGDGEIRIYPPVQTNASSIFSAIFPRERNNLVLKGSSQPPESPVDPPL